MSEDFQKGSLRYEVQQKTAQQLQEMQLDSWNGYAAFSRGEQLWSNVEKQDVFSRMFDSEPIVGYLLELGVWREDAGVFQEICVEKEEQSFLVQQWDLYSELQQDQENTWDCYYRLVATKPQKSNKPLFQEIQCYEVICPVQRLHFFITKEAK